MRVLVSTRPYVGHLHPALPLVEALVAAGHQAVIATSEELALEIEDRGFGWHPAGAHPDRWLDDHPGDDANYGPAVVALKVDDLVDAIDEVGADVLLADATDLAALIAGPATGRPVARYSVCHYLPARTWRRLAGPTLQALRASRRLPPDPALGSLTRLPYLDVMPPAMQVTEVVELADRRVVRYQPRDLAGGDPPDPAERPAVVVSFGTVFANRDRVWDTVLKGCAGLDLPVLDTRAGRRPLHRTLQNSRALICHGGFNTVLSAVSAGTPMVCVPMAGDQYYNAEVVDRLGLGIRISASRLTQRAVAGALGEILSDPSYAARVAVLRSSLSELPPPAAAIPGLERLAHAHSSSR